MFDVPNPEMKGGMQWPKVRGTLFRIEYVSAATAAVSAFDFT